MRRRTLPILIGVDLLALSLLACRPVFAIGWSELIILVVLIVFLFGPILYRLVRSWQAYQEARKNKQK